MTFLLFNSVAASSSTQMISQISFRLSSSFKPKKSAPMGPKIIPARDIVIDFGKHRGKMLGTLPSTYLKWVSKTLRARDFEHWANLADQVLQDPVYRDRIEWEFAENILNGNNAKVATATTNNGSSMFLKDESAVSMLLEISERFGWDNEDKVGWSKVNFELLGSSKGDRIPRVLDKDCDNDEFGESEIGGRRDEKVKKGGNGNGVLGETRNRREKRRERLRGKRGLEEKNLAGFGCGSGDGIRLERRSSQGSDKNQKQKVEIYNPFPGRQALLNKVFNNRRRSF